MSEKLLEDFMKEFKTFREQVYDRLNKQEDFLMNLHDENSEAIDDLTVTILGGEENV